MYIFEFCSRCAGGESMKYIDWLFQWLENYVRLSVKTRTYERYKLIVEQHISQEIGDVALDCLSPLIMQRFITGLLQTFYSCRTEAD